MCCALGKWALARLRVRWMGAGSGTFFFFLFFAFVNAHSSGRHTVLATSLPSRRTGPVLHGSIPASHHCSDVLGKLYFQRLALCRHHAQAIYCLGMRGKWGPDPKAR